MDDWDDLSDVSVSFAMGKLVVLMSNDEGGWKHSTVICVAKIGLSSCLLIMHRLTSSMHLPSPTLSWNSLSQI